MHPILLEDIPKFDWTINLTSVLLGILTILIIPLIKLLVSTLLDLRDTVDKLNLKMGNGNPPDGVLGDILYLKKEVSLHRDWLIANGFDRRKSN